MHIYFDNASTTPLYPEVMEEMFEVQKSIIGNPSSIHYHGRNARATIEKARKVIAEYIHASVGEVYFTSGATESNNWVLRSAVSSLGVQHLVVSAIEHPCVLKTSRALETEGKIQLHILPVDENGSVDLIQLENVLGAINGKVLVSIMHGNNEIGTMQPIQEIGEICHHYSALFHCDAVQTITKYPINLQSLKVHFLSASAHKFHGPKGVGFLFMRNDAILRPLLLGGSQERSVRAGTENVAGIAGMAKAFQLSCDNMEGNRIYIQSLKDRVMQRLGTAYLDIRFNGNLNQHSLSHILSVSLPPTLKSDMVVMNLDIEGISVSSGSACSAGIEEDSHVLQAIHHPIQRKAIRCSFSKFNTMDEVDFCCDVILRLLA